MLTRLILLPLAAASIVRRQNASDPSVTPTAVPTPTGLGNGANWTLPQNVTFVTATMTASSAEITVEANSTGQSTSPGNSSNTIAVTGFSQDGLDQYLGIPFAQPPVGPLRFAHPQPAVYNSSTLNATAPGPACMQNATGQASFFRGVGVSEDCLTLNIMTPAGAANHTAANATAAGNGTASRNSTEGLPVMVWIYGGGFSGGAAYAYLSPYLVQQGISTDKPFILVTIAYRVGIWGFAYGREFAENGAANLGLRDQILALQWVKQNIGAFGGDPSKVTVFGESAGAISIALLMLNQTQDLFRGAIMESGSQSTAPLGPANSTWQAPYNALVQAAGCNVTSLGNGTAITSENATNATDGKPYSSFNCLKEKSPEVLLNASEAVKNQLQWALPFIWAPAVDGDLVPQAPFRMLLNGTFSRVPFITGTNRDEGTGFVPASLPNGLNTALIFNFLLPTPPSSNVTNKILAAYPDNPALGAPFDTGNETFGNSPMIKQITAIITDEAFESRRRFFLRQANQHGFSKTWTYQWQGHQPGYPPHVGYAHGMEVYYVMGVVAASNSSSNYTDADRALSRQMMNYWISFAHDLDPNGAAAQNATAGNSTGTTTLGANGTVEGSTYWAPHNYPENKNSIIFRSAPLNWFAYNVTQTEGGNATSTVITDSAQLNVLNISMFQDDFREDRIATFFDESVGDALFFKRAALVE